MKKSTFLIAMISLAFTPWSQDTLINQNFENWTSITHAEHPSEWLNAYNAEGYLETSPALLQKMTDNTDGSFSLRINSATYGDDTTFGYVLHGSLGDFGPEGGVPFTLPVDSLIFDAKYDIATGDSANIYFNLSLAGSPVDNNVFRIGGTSSEWKRMSFGVNPSNAVPDTLLLAFASSETMGPGADPNSWLQIDNIRFKVASTESSPIPDPSFETWADITTLELDSWTSFNPNFATKGFTPAEQTADAFEASYALQLNTDSVELGGGMTLVQGGVFYGELDDDFNTPGLPFVASPDSAILHYKLDTAVFGDLGYAEIAFYHADSIVAATEFFLDSVHSDYLRVGNALDFTHEPDSIVVNIYGGQAAGTTVKVDKIEFKGGNVSVEELGLFVPTSSIAPNPSTGNTTLRLGLLDSDEVSYTIYNLLGQDKGGKNLGQLNDGIHEIEISSDLPSGRYLIQIAIGEHISTIPWVIQE